jgi:phospholipid N-methyltransferase
MLCEKLPPGSELLCFEREPLFAERLRARFQSPCVHVISDDAMHLRHHLAVRGHEYADCIISAIPLNNPWGEQLLSAISPCLRSGGKLIQVSMANKSLFDREFHHLSRRYVLWNLPPECVHVCEKR